jgi:hypothetical protein
MVLYVHPVHALTFNFNNYRTNFLTNEKKIVWAANHEVKMTSAKAAKGDDAPVDGERYVVQL